MLDKTVTYNTKMIENAKISDMLFEVYDALKERGYNPINQILGYLISGDPGYISSYKEARDKITKAVLDQYEVTEDPEPVEKTEEASESEDAE